MKKSLFLSFILALTLVQGFTYADNLDRWCPTMIAIYQACSPELISNFLDKTSVPIPARTIRASDSYPTLPAMLVKPEAKPYTSPVVPVIAKEEPMGFLSYYWYEDSLGKTIRGRIFN